MSSGELFDWEQLINIDRKWVENELTHHSHSLDKKVSVRAYTVRATGNLINCTSIADVLTDMIDEYVLGKTRIAELGTKAAYRKAIRFFGEKDPDTDGKYGELLLFALVEAVLGCKMVAHKLRSLSNFRDQVKGGDGIFLGNYQIDGKPYASYLIGESKIMTQYSKAINEACESINRFHDPDSASEFLQTELIVAKENLILDGNVSLDELYERLTPTSETFKNQLLVHPILIMYNWEKISAHEKDARTKNEFEELIKKSLIEQSQRYIGSITSVLNKYPEAQKVYLDFFMIPTNDVRHFRNALFHNIHGIKPVK